MTDLYLSLLAQYAARDQAYTLLAVYGIGTVMAGFALLYLSERYTDHPKLAALLRTIFNIYAGGTLLLYLAVLVILPMVKLD